MQIRTSRVGPYLGNWLVTLSDREMERWGKRWGYERSYPYLVDTVVVDGGSAWIEIGSPMGRGRTGLSYAVSVDPFDRAGHPALRVTYRVIAKLIDGNSVDLAEPRSFSYDIGIIQRPVETLRRFLGDLLRNGHLAVKTQNGDRG